MGKLPIFPANYFAICLGNTGVRRPQKQRKHHILELLLITYDGNPIIWACPRAYFPRSVHAMRKYFILIDDDNSVSFEIPFF